METIEQNGVSFTPSKVVNLDELFKDDVKTETDPGSDQKIDDPKVDTIITDKPTDGASNTDEPKEVDTITDADAPKDYDLNEIVLELGEEKYNANEFLDRYESLSKELEEIKGDEFLNRFIEHYKTGGDPSEFLQKAGAKWEEASEVSLLKAQFNKDNADLTDDVREMLFERKLMEQYGVNPDGTFDDETSRDSKIGKQLMKRDADKFRATQIDEQKKFMLPKEPVKQSPQQQFDPAKVKAELMQDKELQSFVEKKALPVSDTFSYEVESPEKVIGMMANVGEFWQMFAKPDGSYDKQALAKVFAFALNPKKYEDAILKLGRDSGAEDYLKEQRNTSGKTQQVISKTTDTDQVTVRNGKIVGGNDKEGFMKAMIAQKR